MKLNILGTEYTLEFRKRSDDSYIQEGNDGYCDETTKELIVEDMELEHGSKRNLKDYQKKVIRHEIVHAFLFESGLSENSTWIHNEDAIDWIASQMPKMVQVMTEADAL